MECSENKSFEVFKPFPMVLRVGMGREIDNNQLESIAKSKQIKCNLLLAGDLAAAQDESGDASSGQVILERTGMKRIGGRER